MESKDKEYYSRLDSLRCYAVLAVLFSHFFAPQVTKHLFIGNAGVNLFFVISGFLITDIILKYQTSGISSGIILQKFYIRRALRIFPLYYFYLLITIVFFYNVVSPVFPWAVTYCMNIYEMFHPYPLLYYHLWSLSIEEQFYIFWPILILVVPNKYLLKVIYTTIFIAVISRLIFTGINHRLFTITCFDAFGFGALFAYLKIFDEGLLKKILNYRSILRLSLLGYLAMISLSFFENHLLDVWFRFFISIISFYLVGICIFHRNTNRKLFKVLLENPKLQYLGKISYGIYMWYVVAIYISINLCKFFMPSINY